MPIGVSEEHEALGRSVRRWVEAHTPPEVVRAGLELGREELPPFWSELARQGWLGLHLPEQHGGEGYGLPELAVVLEELGRACVPGPFLPTVLAGAAIATWGEQPCEIPRNRRSRIHRIPPRGRACVAGGRSPDPGRSLDG